MTETATDARTGAKEKPGASAAQSGKRRPGRAPGLGKVPGSGRKPGAGNHVTKDAKEDVASVLDKNAGPVFTRLCRVALGHRIRLGVGPNATTAYPSEVSQMKALEILARKLRPDLSAVEQTVDQTVREEGPTNTRDLARSVLDVLRMAELEGAPGDGVAKGNATVAERNTLPPATRTDSERPQEPVPAHHGAQPANPTGVTITSETASETHLSNGARVVGIPDAHGDLTRWQSIDLRGMEHRAFNDRAEATEFAKMLQAIREPAQPTSVCYSVNGVELDGSDIIPRELRTPLHSPRPRIIHHSRRNR